MFIPEFLELNKLVAKEQKNKHDILDMFMNNMNLS